jgi:hypothetical protein
VQRRVIRIDEAGIKGDWKADHASLQWLDRDTFGPREKVEHAGQVTHQHNHEHTVSYVNPSGLGDGILFATMAGLSQMLEQPAIETTAVVKALPAPESKANTPRE